MVNAITTNPFQNLNGWNNAQRTKLKIGDLIGLLKEKNYPIEYNLLTLGIEFNRQPLDNWLIENFYAELSCRGYEIPKLAAIDALFFLAQHNSYSPIEEWFCDLRKNLSIQPIDIESISTDYLGVDDDLSNVMLKTCLIGAVKRVFIRGCKHDTCLVLKGSQGIGKSSFWKALASEAWFSDTWQEKPQDLFMQIQRCWFYELAELESMTNKKDAGTLKALLSSSIDSFRVPYARAPHDNPRPSIMVATCNRPDPLNDPTGSRRFHVIDVGSNHLDFEKVKSDRERIFKAAIEAYDNGEPNYLTKEQQEQSNQRNLAFEAEDPFFDRIYDWVNSIGQNSGFYHGFSTEEALIQSSCREEKNIKVTDQKAAADCLRRMGYEKDIHQSRKDGVKQPRKWRNCI